MEPDSKVLAELIHRIREVVNPIRIILFGSAAKGTMTPDSDLDVLVVVPDDTDCRLVSKHIYRNLIGFGKPVDVIVAWRRDVEQYADNFSLVYYPALREGRELYAA